MSRHGRIHGVGWMDRTTAPAVLGLALLAGSGLASVMAQDAARPAVGNPPAVPTARLAPATTAPGLAAPNVAAPTLTPPPSYVPGPLQPTAPPAGAITLPPGTAVVGPILRPEGTGLPADINLSPTVQVVRFQGPEGLDVQVLAPAPTSVPVGDGAGIATVGLDRGVGYRLRLTNITQRPGVELFPVIEVVGHLHRPRELDPSKYPIRVVFTDEELWDVVDRGRLVTKIIYLEDPEQAIPLKLKKDEIPVVMVNPTEEPLKVASALGRVMAIVRIGGRRPTVEEINGGATGDIGIDAVAGMGASRCPFSSVEGDPCQLPCGPVCGTPPPPGRPWLPKDEYLCDGGDHGATAGIGGDGGLTGIDPRDAVMKFDVGLADRTKPRVLPTNRVCIYAPRFAEVRVSTGTNEAIEVNGVATRERTQKFAAEAGLIGSKRLVLNQAAQLSRDRRRASGLKGRVFAGEESEQRVTQGYENVLHAKTGSQVQPAEISRNLTKPGLLKERLRLDGIKTAESAVMTGLTEGTGQTVMSWQPHQMTGIETPPDRPGMAIIKRVNVSEAEPGDKVTFTITYRNMGNTTIRSAAIVDSLLPRLEYIKGTSKGPQGTKFSVGENRVGSSELKWELPGVIAPGASGHVEFQAVVR